MNGKNFYRAAALIALPISLQSLITMAVNLLDNIMLGALGELPLSASALAVQFLSFYQICCMGLGMGASVLVSRFWGMRKMDPLRKTVTLMLRMTFVIGLIFTLLTLAAPERIMRIYSAEQPVIEQGIRYLKWSAPGLLLTGFAITCTIVLRSVGETRIPLLGSCIAFGINLFANWVLIFGHLGAPRMEIEGAALGTLISRGFECCFNCGYFLLMDKKAKYRVRHLAMKCADLLYDYLVVSIPVLVSDALLGLGMNVVAMVMGRIGSVFVAANSITTVTQQLSTALIQGLSQAGCIMTGHSLGEGKVEQARKQGWAFLRMGFAIGALAGIFIFLAGKPMIGLYRIEAETEQVALQLMHAISITVIFQAANSVITKGVLRGGGDTRCLMIADNIFLWVFSIPLGYLAGLYFQLPPFWIYFFLKAEQLLKTVWCMQRLKSGKWIKNVSKNSVKAPCGKEI